MQKQYREKHTDDHTKEMERLRKRRYRAQQKEEINISFKSFHYDIGYAITYEKTEGQSLKHLILELNHRPRKLGKISFNSLYVGFSRVHEQKNLKIMPLMEDTNLNYLKTLTPSPELYQWLKNNNIE